MVNICVLLNIENLPYHQLHLIKIWLALKSLVSITLDAKPYDYIDTICFQCIFKATFVFDKIYTIINSRKLFRQNSLIAGSVGSLLKELQNYISCFIRMLSLFAQYQFMKVCVFYLFFCKTSSSSLASMHYLYRLQKVCAIIFIQMPGVLRLCSHFVKAIFKNMEKFIIDIQLWL